MRGGNFVLTPSLSFHYIFVMVLKVKHFGDFAKPVTTVNTASTDCSNLLIIFMASPEVQNYWIQYWTNISIYIYSIIY